MDGSLVLARQNSGNYVVVFVGLIIILILLLIYFFYKGIQKAHSSPQWIEAHKKIPTTQKNIENVSKQANLTKQEKQLLELTCKKFNAPNIEYLVRDENAIDDLLKKEFDYLLNKPDSEAMKQNLFSIKYKFDRIRTSSQIISTTKSIAAGNTFMYVDKKHFTWTFTIAENNSQGLLLSIPQSFANSMEKPAQMEKLTFTYISKSEIAYLVDARIIRYETAKDGSPLMYISHSSTMNILLRRASRRMPLNKKCTFSAVEVEQNSIGVKEETSFTPKDKKYEGMIKDISPTGCQLICSLPIQKGQFIYVEFALESDSINHSAIGLIVQSEKTDAADRYALHIKFTGIDLKIKNLISAYVYKFLN